MQSAGALGKRGEHASGRARHETMGTEPGYVGLLGSGQGLEGSRAQGLARSLLAACGFRLAAERTMHIEQLLGAVLKGAVGGKKKKHRGAMRFLGGGRGSFLNASTLITAAGVAWGLYESMQSSAVSTSGQGWGAGTAPAAASPPPLPTQGSATPPPLPISPADPQVPAEIVRVIRLTVSAARADGTLSPAEEAAILQHARRVGAEPIVQAELQQPTPLAALLQGTDPAVRDDLYTLAFAIVRADESVSGAERIYLAQLAHQLGIDAATAARLEQDAATRIDTAAQ
jgi:uncharacterized membrane protein YebE (DUF533 family)